MFRKQVHSQERAATFTLDESARFLTLLKSEMKRATFKMVECSFLKPEVVQMCSQFLSGQTVTAFLFDGAELQL